MDRTGKKLSKPLKYAIRGLPLAGAAASVLINLTRTGQQFMVLVVLVWIQVYFVIELFLAGK